MVAGIGDIQGSGAVESEAGRIVDLSLGCAVAIAAPSGHAGSGNGGQLSVGCQFADAVAFELGDVEVARTIHRDVAGMQ